MGEDGKIVTDIAGASKAKITLVKSNVSEATALFHILGTPDNVKTAQYMMKVIHRHRHTHP